MISMYFSYGTKKPNESVKPKDGKWRAQSRFVNAQSLNSWAVLDTANLRGPFLNYLKVNLGLFHTIGTNEQVKNPHFLLKFNPICS